MAHKALVQGVDDLVVHRAAVLRMRMEDDRHRGRGRAGMMIARLDPPLRAIDDYVGHDRPGSNPSVPLGHLQQRLPLQSLQFLIIFVGQLYLFLAPPATAAP
jgi:hypothetical protein